MLLPVARYKVTPTFFVLFSPVPNKPEHHDTVIVQYFVLPTFFISEGHPDITVLVEWV